MNKTVELRDGSSVVIRDMTRADLDESLAFFQALPPDDRAYLRQGVTEREGIERRIKAMEEGSVMRLVAAAGGRIVADGALEFEGHGWQDHIAELRLIIAHDYKRMGLGTLMARELYLLAESRNVEEVVVKFMKPQVNAQKIFERLGFHHEAEYHDFVHDMSGTRQDLIVMRCKLEELWAKVTNQLAQSDWQRAR